MRRCPARASTRVRYTPPNSCLHVALLTLECTDEPRDHHRQEKLTSDYLESGNPACNVRPRENVPVAKRREGDEAVINRRLLGEEVGANKAARPNTFNRPVNLPEK